VLSSVELKFGRLLWTVAVTFYCGVFFRNFLVDAGSGRAGTWGIVLPVTAAMLLLLWMGVEYYLAAPFFQSGIVEPSRFLRTLFAFFVYPFVTYVVADYFWWKWTQFPFLSMPAGLLGLLVLGTGSYFRLASLLALVRATSRQSRKERLGHAAVARADTLSQLPLQRLCRQPRYLGTLLQLLGIALAFNSWGGLVLAAGIGLPLIWVQAREEDVRIGKSDPDGHNRYAARVPLLIPRYRR